MGLFDLLLVAAGLMWPVFARPNERAPNAQPFSKLVPSTVWSEERIIHGTDSVYGRHPYLCSFKIDNRHACGSVIYNQRTLITAAHCLHDMNGVLLSGVGNLKVVCGEFYLHETDAHEQIKSVKSFSVHERYEHNKTKLFPNDIALLELESPLNYDSYVQNGNFPNGPVNSGQNCQLMGWGRYGDSLDPSPVLQEVTMKLVTNTECRNNVDRLISGDHICFWNEGSYKTACTGDSGGPAVCDGQVVGVTSFGLAEEFGLRRCNQDAPSVYTRLSHYMDWVRRNAY